MDDDGWNKINSDHIASVENCKFPAFVIMSGHLKRDTAYKIAEFASISIGMVGIVNVGTLEETEIIEHDMIDYAKFIKGFSVIAMTCAALVKIRKESLEENQWNANYLKQRLENEFIDNKVSYMAIEEICDFNPKAVITKEKLCRIIIKNFLYSNKYEIEVIAGSATFILRIKQL